MENSILIFCFVMVLLCIGLLFVFILKFIDSQFARLEALNKEINDKIDNLKDEIRNL